MSKNLVKSQGRLNDYFDSSLDIVKLEINVENTIFQKGFSFAGPSVFLSKVRFLNCIISNLETYVNHFKSEFIFDNCEFDNVYLSGQFYDFVSFKNCLIKGDLRIVDSVFHKKVVLYKNNFLGGCNLFSNHGNFGSVEFKNGIEFY